MARKPDNPPAWFLFALVVGAAGAAAIVVILATIA